MDYIPDALTRKDWSTEQDALLLLGIKMCGIGNWHEVAKVVQTKDAYECELHYFQTFVECESAPIPGSDILPPLEIPPPPEYDTTPRDSRPSISNESNLALLGKSEATTPGEFAGWMPKRGEFEIEYLNEAEELIASITFSEIDETQKSLDFKLKQMAEYNETLKEREDRRNFALKWGLLDQEVKDFGGQTQEEQEMERELMPMAQALDKSLIMELARSIEAEMRSQADLNLLTSWKRNGIATHDEGFLFERFMELFNSNMLTESQVREWNREILSFMNSTEFRATLSRGIMSSEENELTRSLQIAPSLFLKLKDTLLREFVLRGELSRDIVEGMAGEDGKDIVLPVYELLYRNGLFVSFEDVVCGGNVVLREVVAAAAKAEEERRVRECEVKKKMEEEIEEGKEVHSEVVSESCVFLSVSDNCESEREDESE
jgi:transcriptional adapter 2-alpha